VRQTYTKSKHQLLSHAYICLTNSQRLQRTWRSQKNSLQDHSSRTRNFTNRSQKTV